MSDLLEKISSFKTSNRYFSGLVFIGHRTDKADYDINKCNYTLNAEKDGWFRKTEGLAKGHGLCINDIKITSRNAVLCGDFFCYKAKIEYTNNDFDSKDEADLFWVFVHKCFELDEVLEYINENKEGWYP